MNILSLFDGKSSGFTAFELAGVEVDAYYSAEIDKYAIQVSNAIHPNQTRLGSVTEWRDWDIDWSSIDMIFGGFPCQAWSMAGKQLGDKDERGMLFWTMLDIMKHVRHHNPKADFLIENVKMKKEFEEYITHHMTKAVGDVHKILINSALVSAQNRNRYYWTSFPATQPEDRGIVLADIIEFGGDFVRLEDTTYTDRCKKQIIKNSKHSHQKAVAVCTNANMTGSGVNVLAVNENERVKAISENERGYRPHKNDASKSGISELGRILKLGAGKTDTITTSHSPKLAVNSDVRDLKYRKLTPRECFRLQTTPEHYIDKILNSGELYSHSQNFYNELIKLKVRGSKCKSVKSITVNSQSQAEKLNCAISTTLDSLDMELQKQLGNLSIKANLAPKVGVSVTAKLQKDYALSTTRRGSESTTSQSESVRFALKTSEADGVECVLGTLNQSKNMETKIRLTLTPEENSNLMGIKASNISKTQTVDGLIELSLRKLQEENCEEARLYITLMAINLITAKAIFSFANLEHNTYLCIDSLSRSQCNSLEMGISTLKMENIKPTSNSALYKIAGNGWTDEVIAHILKCISR